MPIEPINRNLLKILSKFDENEWTRLELFVNSPYFINRSNIKYLPALFNHIKRYKANDEQYKNELSRAMTFEAVYWRKYSERTTKENTAFDKLMTELSNGMKRFIFLEDNKDQNEDFNELINKTQNTEI